MKSSNDLSVRSNFYFLDEIIDSPLTDFKLRKWMDGRVDKSNDDRIQIREYDRWFPLKRKMT